ncbi:MAG: plastocyanin/azurin family copper-binding protein [Patescibacteria group bacterium]
MNKKALLILALVVITGAGFLFIRNSKEKGQFQEKVAQAVSSMAVDSSSAVSVDLSGYAFKQEIIKVKKDTKVTWTNKDSAKHTITGDEGNFIDSEAIGKNGTYEKVFDQTGTFQYHCNPHPTMLGAVIVVD